MEYGAFGIINEINTDVFITDGDTMRNLFWVVFILLLQGLFTVPASHAGFIFHKPAYHGKIIDHETKEPLEGVVVVAIYNTRDIIGGPGGPSSDDIGARETLTDENGFFALPSYTALVSPIARTERTKFIIFKPGYSSVPAGGGKFFPFDNCLSLKPFYFPPECSLDSILSKEIGSKQEVIQNYRTGKKITITNGIVELVKLKTWQDRSDANIINSTGFELPLLQKIGQEDYDRIWGQ